MSSGVCPPPSSPLPPPLPPALSEASPPVLRGATHRRSPPAAPGKRRCPPLRPPRDRPSGCAACADVCTVAWRDAASLRTPVYFLWPFCSRNAPLLQEFGDRVQVVAEQDLQRLQEVGGVRGAHCSSHGAEAGRVVAVPAGATVLSPTPSLGVRRTSRN